MRKLFSKLLKKPKNLIVVPFKLPTTTDLSKEALDSMGKRALDRLKGLSNEWLSVQPYSHSYAFKGAN